MKQYPLVQLPGLSAIIAEKDEILVGPDKVTYEIGGKTHKQGGTKMLAEEGSYILSQHLKLPKKVVKSLGYAEKEMSPAKLSRMSDTSKFKDVMDSKDKRYDELAKKTAAIMFEKNAARQDLIFSAQEDYKQSRGMKNDADMASSNLQKRFESGGSIGPVYDDYTSGVLAPPQNSNILFGNQTPYGFVTDSQAQAVAAQQYPGFGKNVQGPVPYGDRSTNLLATDTVGYSTVEGDKRAMYFRPFADDPYFDIQKELLSGGKMTAAQKKMLGERQQRLSTLKTQFPGEQGALIEKEYAKYLRDADKVENDQYLDKFVKLADGSEIPLAGATDAQIDQAMSFRYLNKRTGKPDLVDFRDRQNQGFDPTLRYEQDIPLGNFDPLPQKGLGPVKSTTTSPLLAPKTVDPAQGPGAVKQGTDWQSIINGTQIGLLAADLALTRTKPPYYDYRPSEIAYTRFEALNTKQQERAFNIGRAAIENSNLPPTVKAAQIANMSANMAQGVNEVDSMNYQNKLANDNRNVGVFNQARNFDIQNEQQKNLAYVAEADRRSAQAAEQRQVYLTNIMDVWRGHINNRRDIGLVNQFSRNYDYNLNSQQVEYQQGQGVNPNANRLEGYNTQKIDPRYLNEAGRKALGYE